MSEREERPPAPVRPDTERDRQEPPETKEHPVPGVEHAPEPDAGNVMPAQEQPGTL